MLTILLRFIKRPLVYCILFFLEDKQFLATRILVLVTKNENLEASWPQDFFLKVEPCVAERFSRKNAGNSRFSTQTSKGRGIITT